VTGESGTGKELAARLVHRLGPRADAPFVAVNCVAIAASLIESELFGHEKGAFTGADRRRRGLVETASEGTLFLDEIGDMTPELQGRLLRVIEDRRVRPVGAEREIEVKTRFIAATNRDLEKAVAEGRFRADLFHRLNVLRIEMPSLRARLSDVALLARHFVADFAKRTARSSLAIDDTTLAAMAGYSFPGNVRELRNMIEQAVLLSDADRLGLDLFPALTAFRGPGAPGASVAPPPSPHDLASGEKERIAKALAETGGNVKEAAKLLGVGYDALRYRMRKASETQAEGGRQRAEMKAEGGGRREE
jgi:DNA-binding NtrC family response regulator